MVDISIKWEFNDILSLLKPKINEKILDIGCNTGEFCYILDSQFKVTTAGIDINKDAINKAESTYPRLQFQVKNIFDLVDSKENYDGIVMVEVIEHLIDTDIALDICSKILKPGGRLVISTINKWAYMNKLYCKIKGDKFIFYRDETHVKQFSPYMLYSSLRKQNFRVEHLGTRSLIPFVKDQTIPSSLFGVTLYAVGRKIINK